MFFLRCVFWLSIVYASMSWTREDLASTTWFHTPGTGSISGYLGGKTAGAEAFCKQHPARCLADAASLTTLIDGAKAEDLSSADDRPAAAASPPVPFPIPDPRRHARAVMQTNVR